MREAKNDSFKRSLIEFFLLNIFIFEVLAVSISSYTQRSFIIKLAILILLCAFIFIHYKVEKPDLSNHLNSSNFKRLIYVLLFLLLIFSISLIYSGNPGYGLLKILNFFIGTIPVVLAFYYLIITQNKLRYKILFISLFVEVLILIVAITLIQPFSYIGSTPITLTQWSHVIYGHFIGPVYILFLLALLNSKANRHMYFFAAGTLLSFYGTYLSGLKAAFYGIIIFTGIILIIYLFKKLLTTKQITFILSAIVLSVVLLFLLHPDAKKLPERFNFLDSDFDKISAITRVEAWEISWDMFVEHPVVGTGFGGFKDYNNNQLTDRVNYPHNIFVEFAVELGIIGLVIFIYLLYLIFSSTQKISFNVTIFFCFALWFALSSKDIPSNVLLWLGLALIQGKSQKSKVKRKNKGQSIKFQSAAADQSIKFKLIK